MTDRYLKKEKKKLGLRPGTRWTRALLVVILSLAAMMGYVWKQVKVTQLVNVNYVLQKEKERLINENKTLAMEIESLSGLGRIEKIATEELGMQFSPTYPVVFRIQSFRQQPKTGPSRSAADRLRGFVNGFKRVFVPTAEARSVKKD